MNWTRIEEKLPNSGENWTVWAYDGKDVFISKWGKIDCDYEGKFKKTNGFWFGRIDGTECFSEDENITHWMEIIAPEPPIKI